MIILKIDKSKKLPGRFFSDNNKATYKQRPLKAQEISNYIIKFKEFSWVYRNYLKKRLNHPSATAVIHSTEQKPLTGYAPHALSTLPSSLGKERQTNVKKVQRNQKSKSRHQLLKK